MVAFGIYILSLDRRFQKEQQTLGFEITKKSTFDLIKLPKAGNFRI